MGAGLTNPITCPLERELAGPQAVGVVYENEVHVAIEMCDSSVSKDRGPNSPAQTWALRNLL